MIGDETAAGVEHLVQLPTDGQRQHRRHVPAAQPQPTCMPPESVVTELSPQFCSQFSRSPALTRGGICVPQ